MTLRLKKFTDIVQDKSGGNKKLPQELFLLDGQYPVVDQGKKFIAGYINDQEYLVKSTDLPVVIFGDHTKAIKFVDFPFAMGADGVKVLKPKDDCDPKYLYHYLRYAKIPDAGYSRHFKFLKELEIPLPPLEEQRRITSILDQADELRQKRQQAIEKLDQLLQATFIDMFGDPVSNPKQWKLGELEDLGVLDRGISKHRPRGAPELLGGIHPLIQTGDVARSQGYIRSYTSTYSDLGLAQSKKWAKGTLCITIAANIANTGILTFDACFPDSVVGFTANQESNAEFVQGLFLFFKQILEEKAPQSAQKNINLAILRALEIPIPPKDLQEKWSKVAQSIEAQKQKLYKQLDIQNQLFSSLQNQAFSGNL